MGYFSNGSEGMQYESMYCDRCVHNHPEHGCPVLHAHTFWNYEECLKPDSILHKMIPIKPDTFCGECFCFLEDKTI